MSPVHSTRHVSRQNRTEHRNQTMSLPEIPSQLLLARNQQQHHHERSQLHRTAVNVDDFQILAKQVLPKDLYEYLSSGSDNEVTLCQNRIAFDTNWFLRPRVMRPVGNLSTTTTLFDDDDNLRVSMPVFVSPAGVHALCSPEHGECATARACARMGIVMGVSQHSTRTIEDVAKASSGGPKFYQAYILKDRMKTLSLIRRAIQAGYQGIFLTVDSVRFGYREADARNGFNALPPPHRLVNYDDDPVNSSNTSSSNLDQTYNSQQHKAWDQNSEQMFEQNVTWDDVTWIKHEIIKLTPSHSNKIPLVVKGIMTGEDAVLAVDAGADIIMVSNHGGRQLDGCLATIDVLPEVVQALKRHGRNDVPVWIDGGFRRGTDVLKALALGASAVGIGKPVFYALGVGGEDALVYMLQLLKTELESAMAICGVETINDITSSLVTNHPNSSTSASSISRPTFQVRASL